MYGYQDFVYVGKCNIEVFSGVIGSSLDIIESKPEPCQVIRIFMPRSRNLKPQLPL